MTSGCLHRRRIWWAGRPSFQWVFRFCVHFSRVQSGLTPQDGSNSHVAETGSPLPMLESQTLALRWRPDNSKTHIKQETQILWGFYSTTYIRNESQSNPEQMCCQIEHHTINSTYTLQGISQRNCARETNIIRKGIYGINKGITRRRTAQQSSNWRLEKVLKEKSSSKNIWGINTAFVMTKRARDVCSGSWITLCVDGVLWVEATI
jgi:hypothetical protein